MFSRLHHPGEYEGTCVGLSLCEKIVQNHDGYIYALVTPGGGSFLYFSAGNIKWTKYIKKIDDRRSRLEDKYHDAVHKFIAGSSSEISSLQKKVEQLEGQLKAKGTYGGSASRIIAKPKSAVKSAAKKVVRTVKKALPSVKK